MAIRHTVSCRHGLFNVKRQLELGLCLLTTEEGEWLFWTRQDLVDVVTVHNTTEDVMGLLAKDSALWCDSVEPGGTVMAFSYRLFGTKWYRNILQDCESKKFWLTSRCPAPVQSERYVSTRQLFDRIYKHSKGVEAWIRSNSELFYPSVYYPLDYTQ